MPIEGIPNETVRGPRSLGQRIDLIVGGSRLSAAPMWRRVVRLPAGFPSSASSTERVRTRLNDVNRLCYAGRPSDEPSKD
jgi:hypothetical protein